MTVIDIAKRLIEFDSSGPPAKEKPLAMWISDYLNDLGVSSEVQDVFPERSNVIAKIGEGKEAGLVLSGHIDVVPAGDLELWKMSGPFDPIVKDNKLFGRGACDMKGPDACLIQAVEDLLDRKFKRQLTLMFTAGEDTGGWFINKIVSEGKITPKEARFGVIPEPTMMNLVRCHKASGGASIQVKGVAAHSSRPEMGINAILKSIPFLDEIIDLQKELEKIQHPLLGSTTIVPTIINGGFKGNIIPDSCTINLNARLITAHQGSEHIKKWMENVIAKCKKRDPEFEATILSARGGISLDIPENHEVVQIMKNILGTEPIGAPYFTEAVTLTNSGIPTVICGPGNIDQAHTADEFISLDQLNYGVKTFKKLIEYICL